MIREKKLKPKTKISHSQSYWFQFEGHREVLRSFPELYGVVEPKPEMEATLATPEGVTKTGWGGISAVTRATGIAYFDRHARAEGAGVNLTRNVGWVGI